MPDSLPGQVPSSVETGPGPEHLDPLVQAKLG